MYLEESKINGICSFKRIHFSGFSSTFLLVECTWIQLLSFKLNMNTEIKSKVKSIICVVSHKLFSLLIRKVSCLVECRYINLKRGKLNVKVKTKVLSTEWVVSMKWISLLIRWLYFLFEYIWIQLIWYWLK